MNRDLDPAPVQPVDEQELQRNHELKQMIDLLVEHKKDFGWVNDRAFIVQAKWYRDCCLIYTMTQKEVDYVKSLYQQIKRG